MIGNPQPSSVFNQQELELREQIQRGFITRVYGWMTLGLIITAAAGFFTLVTPGLLQGILSVPFLFFGLLIGELVLVVIVSRAAASLSPVVAGALFAVYAALNGVTLSILFLMYTTSSIALVFGITACTFGIMTLFGFTTQRDLTRLGSLLIMGLIGMILASLVNLFFQNPAIYWITTYIGVIIFIGLIAYDTQKLKRLSLQLDQDGQIAQRASILGALTLYLDFINLFVLLLRILGRRK
jgi:uncharacterized protein